MDGLSENRARMQRGELYIAFDPELIALRNRCKRATHAFNDSRDVSRRAQVQLWRELVLDQRPMPPVLEDPEADAAQFASTDPWVEPPLRADYGEYVRIAPGAYINHGATFIDTVPITIGARTLVGPNCSFYSGTHPLDPAVRDGLRGPEGGKPITIGEDCWLGGGVHVVPGVTIGRGATIGAGSVVTRDIPPFTVAVGNPARVIRKVQTSMDPSQSVDTSETLDAKHGAEVPMAAVAAVADNKAALSS